MYFSNQHCFIATHFKYHLLKMQGKFFWTWLNTITLINELESITHMSFKDILRVWGKHFIHILIVNSKHFWFSWFWTVLVLFCVTKQINYDFTFSFILVISLLQFKMEDNLKFFNCRQSFWKIEDYLIFLKMEDDLIFLTMKTTSTFQKWKTTLFFNDQQNYVKKEFHIKLNGFSASKCQTS